MRDQRIDVALEDPRDPMLEVEAQQNRPPQPKRNVPRLNPDIWDHLVDAHGGDDKAAKRTLDRLMKKEADSRRAARNA
jgi:hypothetical protein